MRAMILALAVSGCTVIRPEIPEALLQPVADPVSETPRTRNALAAGFIARGAALEEANGQLDGIAEIMRAR